ncbi:hypothetical protein ACFL3X_01000 [Gemmatimonadota bacterium]
MEKIENDIRMLNGVVSANVVLSHDGLEIDEVHIVATSARAPKQIVRDVETLILGNHDIRVDHKKVSIAQIGDIDLDSIAQTTVIIEGSGERPERIRFVSAISNTYGLRWEVNVELERAGIPSTAAANGAGSRQNKARLVAQATAEALNNYLGDKQAVAIDEVQIVEGAVHKTAVVTLTHLTDRTEKALVGSSLMEDDMPRAVVHATLDAINRALT